MSNIENNIYQRGRHPGGRNPFVSDLLILLSFLVGGICILNLLLDLILLVLVVMVLVIVVVLMVMVRWW